MTISPAPDSDQVHAHLDGRLHQLRGLVRADPVLAAEVALCAAGRRQDAQHELGPGERVADLLQLVLVIEGHLGDPPPPGEHDVGLHLARVGEDDPLRGHAQVQHLAMLVLFVENIFYLL